nr:VOC family protein [Streptomyces californicus]
MAVQPEGTPCWADAMFVDIEGAKSFYGDVLGWTFGESASEFGDYTQALSLIHGEVLMEPMRIGDFGTMALARDPGGAVFGIWQAGRHEGFETEMGAPGGYCWSEVFTRDPQRVDAFYPAVFPYTVRKFDDESMDFTMFDVAGRTVLGRMAMGEEFPPEVPSYVNVYFAVPDCDAAVAKATARGGELRYGPVDSPFGRFAAISDPQGAAFAVIDLGTTVGRMPATSPAD